MSAGDRLAAALGCGLGEMTGREADMGEMFDKDRAQGAIGAVLDTMRGLGLTVPEAIHVCHVLDATMESEYPGLYRVVTGERTMEAPAHSK